MGSLQGNSALLSRSIVRAQSVWLLSVLESENDHPPSAGNIKVYTGAPTKAAKLKLKNT